MTNTVGIVGAGPVGSLLAVYLARRGISSELYEKRPDMRRSGLTEGRSINLAVSTRGLYALREIGLEDYILTRAIPMHGRMIHAVDGRTTFQRYSIHDQDCLYSMSRGDLNQALMSQAEKTGKVKIHFGVRADKLDLDSNTLHLSQQSGSTPISVQHEQIFATDGSSSILRETHSQIKNYSCSQEILNYGYKELTLPAGPNQSFQLEKNALHIWPRGNFMLIALPNLDGSFTCTLFLRFEGALSFATLHEDSAVRELFQSQFQDVVPLLPDLIDQFFQNPTGKMVTVKMSPWHYKDQLLLLGDAAHAIVPFFGQGMNCGFEDCTLFNEILGKGPNWTDAFAEFSKVRPPQSDSIADMALENFIEMRDKVGQPKFLIQKAVEAILQREFPGDYVSRYSLVTFSRVPYNVAFQAGKIHDEILSELCEKLDTPENVNLDQAKKLIQSKLRPLAESFA